jgi:hypothetical protein
LTALIEGVTALTRGQLEASERERKKLSVLSRLSRRQTFLFDALSASDWRDGNPKRTKEAAMILEDRDVERNWNLLIDLTEKWPGGGGKQARVHPVPREGLHITGKAWGIHGIYVFPVEEKQTGQEGPETESTERTGEIQRSGRRRPQVLCQERFYIPKSVYEGKVQIQMAVRTLDLLTNHKSIVSDGYRYGLEFLDG